MCSVADSLRRQDVAMGLPTVLVHQLDPSTAEHLELPIWSGSIV